MKGPLQPAFGVFISGDSRNMKVQHARLFGRGPAPNVEKAILKVKGLEKKKKKSLHT